MHTTPIQIRFNDVDQMGHVNNAVIMEYLDLGKDAFFSGHGLSPTKSDFTVMVVHYDVDFKAQIHYHDKIQVETSIERFGTKKQDKEPMTLTRFLIALNRHTLR